MANCQKFNDDKNFAKHFSCNFSWVKHIHMCACVYMFNGQSGNESGYPEAVMCERLPHLICGQLLLAKGWHMYEKKRIYTIFTLYQ